MCCPRKTQPTASVASQARCSTLACIARASWSASEPLRESGKLYEARASLETALALAPGHVQSSTRRGAGLYELGFYEASDKAYEQAIAAGADTPPLRNALGRAYLKRGAFNEAAEELGISVNAVRKAKSRVLRRLRDEVGEMLA